jgi:hypothetical protein
MQQAEHRGASANFHEKALFVKADLAAPVERWSSVSFAMLPSALLVSLLFGDSVHYEIHLFGLLIEGAAIFGAVSPPACGGWTKFAWRSRLI